MKNLDLTCTIADNTEIGNIYTAETRWTEYFAKIYRKYCENHKGFNLAFPPGTKISLDTKYSPRTFIEREWLNVVDFCCGTCDSRSLQRSEVIFYVRVLGKVVGDYVLPSEEDEIYSFRYEVKADTSNYQTTKQIPIEYDFPFDNRFYGEHFFICAEPTPSVLLEHKKLALTTLVPKSKKTWEELGFFDNFTQSCILPIVRNALVECLPVEKVELPSQINPLATNPYFGTW